MRSIRLVLSFRPLAAAVGPLAVLALAALLTPAHPAVAGSRQIPVMRIEAAGDVAAPPAAVWAFLTTGRNFATWCPVWKSPANVKVNLAKVGDSVDFTDEWGNGGRSVVTFLVPDRELRVAHEPNDGSYVCQARLVLTPGGAGTHIVAIEQYTDESAPDAMKATAAKVQGELDAMLAAVRSGVAPRR